MFVKVQTLLKFSVVRKVAFLGPLKLEVTPSPTNRDEELWDTLQHPSPGIFLSEATGDSPDGRTEKAVVRGSGARNCLTGALPGRVSPGWWTN